MKLIIQQALCFSFLFAYATARADETPAQRLRRNLQVATKNYGQNSVNLGVCEGDCSTDADCRSGLVCFQRDSGDDAPGCALSEKHRASRVDFCVNSSPQAPVAAPVAAPPTSSGGTRAVYVGNNNVSNLGMCQGDCDRDSDCASGLKCHQRSSGEGAPGCILSSSLLNSDSDFCVASSGGTPTPPAPFVAPVSSPVRSPSTGNTFALKLYWEQGYFWQEETIERKWCMSCRNSCSAGGEIAIFDCDDSPTQWEFVFHGPNEVQVKVANQNVCVEEIPYNELELNTCDSANQKQRFVAFGGSFSDPRFEVSPKLRQGWCFTQRHHPKNNESVHLEPCVTARKSNTSYWNKY